MPLRLRVSTIRRGDKVYRYHQLTRSVRRDGRPTHEIVAHLGRLKESEAEAIRLALRGVAQPGPARGARSSGSGVLVRLGEVMAEAARRYLDVMVVHRLWQQWGFRAFFQQHLPRGREVVDPADVVEVLVANRCLAPCSKLRVTEWTPRTVLPELLGFEAGQLNNTRLHRVLERLEGIEPALTRWLSEHPLRGGIDSVLYLDITDTWFVGDGGDLGAEGTCKDGSLRRSRVQIALAVDRRGLPLRWEALAGNAPESPELPKWIEALDKLPAFAGVPLVFDRGFSTNANLIGLVKAVRRFVTCARQPRLRDWTAAIDFEAISRTPANERPPSEVLLEAGLTAHPDDDDLFYLDQGVRRPYTTRGSLPEMRVVLFFRRSQYAFDTHRISENRRKFLEEVDRINADLARARRHRMEEKTRAKVERALEKRQLAYDYKVRLEPVVSGSGVRSFRVQLDATGFAPLARDYNAGWRILLASAEDNRPAPELIRLYDQKQQVEFAFRTIKSWVRLRPIRHQQTPKIRAHITLCMLAMMLDRCLELRLRDAGVKDAVDRVYEALEPCRLHLLRDGRGRHRQLTITALDAAQRRILRALQVTDLGSRQALAEFRGV